MSFKRDILRLFEDLLPDIIETGSQEMSGFNY